MMIYPSNSAKSSPTDALPVLRHITFLLALLLVGRLVVQGLLYHSGFNALSADEFGRTVIAANWIRTGKLAWHGPWLPFHAIFFGLALGLVQELLWVPRVIVILIGIASILVMYAISSHLFHSRQVGFLSALLLAVNPAHLWLSSTPLTELPHTFLVLAFFWQYLHYLDHPKPSRLYISALCLALAGGFRFESWLIALLFSLFLLYRIILSLSRSPVPWSSILHLVLAALLLWIFPIFWIINNYRLTGDPTYFIDTIRNYKLNWYGSTVDFKQELGLITGIDPYACTLGILGTLTLAWKERKSIPALSYVFLATVPFVIFSLLHGGQIEPPGNTIRYFAMFLFLLYPGLAYLLNKLFTCLPRLSAIRIVIAFLLLGFMLTTQLKGAFQFTNDPSAAGLAVGQHIRTLRQMSPQLATQPVMVELVYWNYLATHVGANDITTILYDRELSTTRDTNSLMVDDLDALRACLVTHRISYLVLTDPILREIAETELELKPDTEINAYFFYPISEQWLNRQVTPDSTCPLTFHYGY